MRRYLDDVLIEPADRAEALASPANENGETAREPDRALRRLPLVAHLVSRLVAARPTPADEIPALIAVVDATLSGLLDPPRREAPPEEPTLDSAGGAGPAPRHRERRAQRPRIASPEPPKVPAPPPLPRLVRRADALAPTSPAETPALLAHEPAATLRGVVRWFDPTRQMGALRLPGLPEDLPIDPNVFAQSGVTRLFKGQEVDAQIDRTQGTVRIAAIALPGTVGGSSVPGMIAGGRRPRIVIVEKKRDGLKRVAARSEAEQVLGPHRTR